MGKGLYLGKAFDPRNATLGAPVELDPRDLLTHGLIVGMTGSGKTGLAIALLEEVLRQGVPVLAIDPKGDLANLLLLFDRLEPAAFEPWIDPAEASREGKTVSQAAADAAESWKQGLAEWGLTESDVAALHQKCDFTIYTPGSGAGVGLNVLQSPEAPAGSFDAMAEDLRDEISAIVSGLLGLLQIDADPLKSREHILLSNLIEHFWRAGQSLTLEGLLQAVADPPMDRLGALPLESVFPAKQRQELVMALNNLVASPGFESWREGEPIDVEKMLGGSSRPRVSIVYTAHLSDEERLFVTALLLEKVKTWVRKQRGTSELRALVYMDEIFGYFPPHPANPPTKKPLLSLLKQARAQGVGIVLATQNPVDLDYKGLANMGTWMVGRLQTERDRERLQDGLLGAGADAAAVTSLLDATRKRVFLLHDVHRKGPELIHSRWAMAYLRGPVTREEVGQLMASRRVASTAAAAGAPAGTAGASVGSSRAGAAASAAGAPAGPPLLPAPFRHNYLPKYKGEMADPFVLVKAAVRFKGVEGEQILVRAWPLTGENLAECLENEVLVLEEDEIQAQAAGPLRYAELPDSIGGGGKSLEKVLKERLPDKLSSSGFNDPTTGEQSRPGETREAFAARLLAAGGGPEADKLKLRLEKRQRDLVSAEADLAARKKETWVAVGSAILSNLGLFSGRKKTISGASGVLTKNRMESSAESRVEEAKAEIASLEKSIAELTSVDPARFEMVALLPPRNGVKILRYDLLWVY